MCRNVGKSLKLVGYQQEDWSTFYSMTHYKRRGVPKLTMAALVVSRLKLYALQVVMQA